MMVEENDDDEEVINYEEEMGEGEHEAEGIADDDI